MSAGPAETIRTYLDEHEGREEVHVEELLTTWNLDSWTEEEKSWIAGALESAGVCTEPSLKELDRSDPVCVYVAGEAKHDSTPPWGLVSRPATLPDPRPTGPEAPVAYAPPQAAHAAYPPPQVPPAMPVPDQSQEGKTQMIVGYCMAAASLVIPIMGLAGLILGIIVATKPRRGGHGAAIICLSILLGIFSFVVWMDVALSDATY